MKPEMSAFIAVIIIAAFVVGMYVGESHLQPATPIVSMTTIVPTPVPSILPNNTNQPALTIVPTIVPTILPTIVPTATPSPILTKDPNKYVAIPPDDNDAYGSESETRYVIHNYVNTAAAIYRNETHLVVNVKNVL